MVRKTVLLTAFAFLGISFFAGFAPPTECPSKEAKALVKKQLKPYKYDSATTTRFNLKSKSQRKEVEVPLFLTEKYKLIFTVQGMPVRPSVKIYNKDFESKTREMLFNSDDVKDKTEFEFETKKWTRKVYVNIEVPPSADTLNTGCVFFVVGYE